MEQQKEELDRQELEWGEKQKQFEASNKNQIRTTPAPQPATSKQQPGHGSNTNAFSETFSQFRNQQQTAPQVQPTPAPFQQQQQQQQGGQNYDDLLRQAANFSRSRNYAAAAQANQQAVKINPARPDAYANLGGISLYGSGDLSAALANSKEAIQRGGVVYFRVMHDHQNMSYQDHCEGNLGIGRDRVEFSSPLHNFRAVKEDVKEVKGNKWNPLRGGGKDDFHVELKDKRHFNLLPVTNPKPVREMMLQLAK